MTHLEGARHSGHAVAALAIAVALLLLLLPAVAAASAATPTVTIVGPGYMSQDPPPTEPVAVLDDAWVQLYLDDGGWGADRVRFSNDGGSTWDEGQAFQEYLSWSLFYDVDIPFDGLKTVTAQFSADGGATWGPTASATTLIDEQSPVLSVPDGYWNNHYAYRLSARDQIGLSGVQRLWYRVDAGELVEVTNTAPLGTALPLKTSFSLPGETGTAHSIDYLAADYAGNYSGLRKAVRVKANVKKNDIGLVSMSAYVVIDRTAPIVNARGAVGSWQRGPVVVRFSARDRGGAGLAYIQYSVTRAGAKKPGAWTTGNSAIVTRPGKSRVWYRALDAAQPKGNASAARSVLVKVL
jgi:hypothetical protein